MFRAIFMTFVWYITLFTASRLLRINGTTQGSFYLIFLFGLFLTLQDETLKEPLNRLKQAVDDAMPEQIKIYDDECAAQQLAKYVRWRSFCHAVDCLRVRGGLLCTVEHLILHNAVQNVADTLFSENRRSSPWGLASGCSVCCFSFLLETTSWCAECLQ